MEYIDFVIPLKSIGLITQAVLEAINFNYHPRRIIIITNENEIKLLKEMILLYNIDNIVYYDEHLFFMKNLEISYQDIISHYDENVIGDKREPGWWIQQLLKFGAATQIDDISEVYVVWDSDLIPLRPWPLLINKDGITKYYIAILQQCSRSEFNTTQYARSTKEICGFDVIEPNEGTFIAHHMIFHVKYVKELLNLIINNNKDINKPWPLLIISYSSKYFRISEYKMYSTFMLNYYNDQFYYHEYQLFGNDGIRIRESKQIIEEMTNKGIIENNSISYEKIYYFFKEKEPKISYVQIEHLYNNDI